MVEIQPLEALPRGLGALRDESRAEGFELLVRLETRWRSVANLESADLAARAAPPAPQELR